MATEDSRARRTRQIFMVVNPDRSDSDDSDTGKPPRVPWGPRSQQPRLPAPDTPLSVDTKSPLHQSNHSNPALSSPSTMSSPVESTPPPSTPGMNGQSDTDRGERGLKGATRIPHYPQFISEISKPATSALSLVIMVTADSDQFYSVNVTGASGPAIQEKMFSKLSIPDEDQPYYAIYRTEIDSYAIGEALQPDALFSICQTGDNKGTLKFLVTRSSAQHADVPRSETVTIPAVPPLKGHSSRSRNDSVSSAGDHFRGGVTHAHQYAASVPDTTEALERDSQRSNRPPIVVPPAVSGPNGFLNSPYLSPAPDPVRPVSPIRKPTNRRLDKMVRLPGTPTHPLPAPPSEAADPHIYTRSGSENNRAPASTVGSTLRQFGSHQSPSYSEDMTSVGHWKVDPGNSRNSPVDSHIRRGGRASPADQATQVLSPHNGSQRSPLNHVVTKHRPSPISNKSLHVPPAPRVPPPAPPTDGMRKNERGGMSVPRAAWAAMKGTKSELNLRAFAHPHPPELQPGVRPGPSAGDLARNSPSATYSGAFTSPAGHEGTSRSAVPFHSKGRPGLASRQEAERPSSNSIAPSSRSFRTLHPEMSPAVNSLLKSRDGRVPHESYPVNSPPRTPVSPHASHPTQNSTEMSSLSKSTQGSSRLGKDDSPDATLRPEDRIAFANMFGSSSASGGTLTRPPKSLPPVPGASGRRPSVPDTKAYDFGFNGPVNGGSDSNSDDSEDESGTWDLWQVRPQTQPQRPPLAPIETEEGTSTLTPKPKPPSPRRPLPTDEQPFDKKEAFMRPPPEQVYERLDDYFKQHNLDALVIEAPSGGTSPTNVDQPILPLPPAATAGNRFSHKKSIRVVADEQRNRIKRDRKSAATDLRQKRSTKLWGSKLEEVTSGNVMAMFAPPSAGAPESPTTAPKPIFKWVRGELIGKGTYGRVYLALNATTGEMIAVKQVEMPQTAADREDQRQISVVEALKSESETLKDLDHPHIVQYLGFEETPNFLSIFLEYVPGGSVGSCIRKHGKFSEEVTKSFTAQILDGLEYLHSKGILHRDLKADNILVENTGICKISDFGISKRTDDTQAAAFTAMQGTVFWMAPEVVKAGKQGYTSKIDIWSVGCVVLEMWCGHRPWQDQETFAVMFKLYSADTCPPVPDEIQLSPLAEDFRLKCFAIKPEERPTAAVLRNHAYLELPMFWSFSGDFKS